MYSKRVEHESDGNSIHPEQRVIGVFDQERASPLLADTDLSPFRRNLVARIAHHLRRHKRMRGHIDYLLAAPE